MVKTHKRKPTKSQLKGTRVERKQGKYLNVLGRPRKNNWGTRFKRSVHLDISRGLNTPITGSFASRIIKAKTGAILKGYALINGVSKKITVHIYY